jgi:hypothetical protein
MTFFRQTLITATVLATLGFGADIALAQSDAPLPELPKPIENLVNEGAQIRYLGRDYGVDAWITIKNGKEQYFYVVRYTYYVCFLNPFFTKRKPESNSLRRDLLSFSVARAVRNVFETPIAEIIETRIPSPNTRANPFTIDEPK